MSMRQPVFILSEDSEVTKGKDAQENNINAAKAVAAAVRTTLGPKGMDKMLANTLGDIVITNDGATILEEMDIEHPAAKMVVQVAETQEDEVGDGTTTAVAIAGELLKQSEDLLEKDVHPTIIASGLRQASHKCQEILNQEIAKKVSIENEERLKKVAETAMTGKGAESARDTLKEITVNAITAVADKKEDGYQVNIDNIKIEKKVGGRAQDTQLVEGMIIDKEKVHPEMPKSVENAKIALISAPIEHKETEVDAEIQITNPDQLQQFLDEEEAMLKKLVNKIKESGANVVFCQKGIDDMAQHYLAKEGILAVRRARKSDLKKLARATGGNVVSNIDEISEEDLGQAGHIKEKRVSNENMLFIEDCKNPRSVSLLVRGGTEHVVDEVERALEDALKVVAVAVEDGKIVAGGGAPEVELAHRLREYAASVGGREQLAIEAFANALEIVPRTLAENAGLDPIDALVDLRNKHEAGEKAAGLNVFDGEVIDMWEAGVVEPLRVKTQAVDSASETAVMVLRIDDVISGGSGSGGDQPDMPGGPGGGMPGGMGGMGGMM
ncbi:Chaperonin GroEL HSP60 family [Methanonatronarchaeum thermophilum]|uniref:Chaperonin GroEL HSP60 family n=1 Tax=Methanonatronarchaeum thermophilum TaxID=1927129 RepID=A0A1Y3GFZ0_9EURY|nr:thermosome subunit alpha [Methanonatronarchaeum thermophilum]OUJ18286.1 Chaperonin GroEL HSP60 family [Methanonatronarchaeum thermophilum]